MDCNLEEHVPFWPYQTPCVFSYIHGGVLSSTVLEFREKVWARDRKVWVMDLGTTKGMRTEPRFESSVLLNALISQCNLLIGFLSQASWGLLYVSTVFCPDSYAFFICPHATHGFSTLCELCIRWNRDKGLVPVPQVAPRQCRTNTGICKQIPLDTGTRAHMGDRGHCLQGCQQAGDEAS